MQSRIDRYLAAKGVSPEQFQALLEERSAQDCASTEMLVQWLRATMDYDFFIQARQQSPRDARAGVSGWGVGWWGQNASREASACRRRSHGTVPVRWS